MGWSLNINVTAGGAVSVAQLFVESQADADGFFGLGVAPRYKCFSPYIGLGWFGETSVNICFPTSGSTDFTEMGGALVMRLNNWVPGSITASIGDTGTGKIFRSTLPPDSSDVTYEIMDMNTTLQF